MSVQRGLSTHVLKNFYYDIKSGEHIIPVTTI